MKTLIDIMQYSIDWDSEENAKLPHRDRPAKAILIYSDGSEEEFYGTVGEISEMRP